MKFEDVLRSRCKRVEKARKSLFKENLRLRKIVEENELRCRVNSQVNEQSRNAEILKVAASFLGSSFGAKRCSIFSVARESMEDKRLWNANLEADYTADSADSLSRICIDHIQEVITEPDSYVMISDMRSFAASGPFKTAVELLNTANIGAMFASNILRNGAIVGVVVLLFNQIRQLSEEEVIVLLRAINEVGCRLTTSLHEEQGRSQGPRKTCSGGPSLTSQLRHALCDHHVASAVGRVARTELMSESFVIGSVLEEDARLHGLQYVDASGASVDCSGLDLSRNTCHCSSKACPALLTLLQSQPLHVPTSIQDVEEASRQEVCKSLSSLAHHDVRSALVIKAATLHSRLTFLVATSSDPLRVWSEADSSNLALIGLMCGRACCDSQVQAELVAQAHALRTERDELIEQAEALRTEKGRLQVRIEQAKVLRTVIREIRGTLDTERILRVTAQTVGSSFDADRFIIRCSYHPTTFSAKNNWGIAGEYCRNGFFPIGPLPELPAVMRRFQLLAQTNQTVCYVEDVNQLWPGEDPNDPEVQGMLAFFKEHKLFSTLSYKTAYHDDQNGVITLHSSTRRVWTPEEWDMLSAVADQVGIAFVHSRFIEQERVAREALRVQNDALTYQLNRAAILQAIILQVRQSLEPQTILACAAKLLAQAVSASHCFIFQLSPLPSSLCSTSTPTASPLSSPTPAQACPQSNFAIPSRMVTVTRSDPNASPPTVPWPVVAHPPSPRPTWHPTPTPTLNLARAPTRSFDLATISDHPDSNPVDRPLPTMPAGPTPTPIVTMDAGPTRAPTPTPTLKLPKVVTVSARQLSPYARLANRTVPRKAKASCPSFAPAAISGQYPFPLPPELLHFVQENLAALSTGGEAALPVPSLGPQATVLHTLTTYRGVANGIIGIVSTNQRAWTAADRDLLTAVADHVGIALAHAKYMELQVKQQVELEVKNQELVAAVERARVLRSIVSEIRDTLDTSRILETSARLLGESLHADRCLIRRTSTGPFEGQRLTVDQTTEYVAPGAMRQDPDVPVPAYCVQRMSKFYTLDEVVVYMPVQEVLEGESEDDPGRAEAIEYLKRHNLVSVAGGKTTYQGQMNGFITLHFPTLRHLSPGEADLLCTTIEHLGIALEHARLLRNEQGQKQLLALKNAELELATREAQSASQAKSEFLSVISHELRTPMAAVLGIAQLLLHTPLNPQQQEFCETIMRSGNALVDLIGELLDCGKIEHGSLVLEPSDFSVEELLEGVVDLMAPTASSKGLYFAYALAPSVPQVVHSDPRRIRQILINVVGNAIKFTDSGQVTIEVWMDTASPRQSPTPSPTERDPQQFLRVDIADTGPGIDPRDHGRLFKYFQQLDSSKSRRFNGTGIGLYLSKNLSVLLGGDLFVDSSPGAGSVFHVCIPVSGPSQLAVTATDLLRQDLQDQSGASNVPDVTSLPRPLPVRLPVPCRLLLAVPNRVTARMVSSVAQSVGASTFAVTSSKDLPPPERDVTDVLVVDEWAGQAHGHVTLRSVCMPVILLARVADHSTRISEDGSALSPPHVTSRDVTCTLLHPIHRTHLVRALECCLGPAPVPPSTCQSVNCCIDSNAGLDAMRAVANEQAPPATVKLPPAAQPNLRLTVLLAEDNALNAKIVTLMLHRLGHDVEVVVNGLEAVRAVSAKRYDAVLMDWMMPVMDGLTACQQILQEHPDVNNRPFLIMLTANASPADRQLCVSAGVNHYLTKPVRMEQLADVLRLAMLRGGLA